MWMWMSYVIMWSLWQNINLEDKSDDKAEDEYYDGESGQEMPASDDLRLQSPGDQLGESHQQDYQGDAAVREEHVGTALQHTVTRLQYWLRQWLTDWPC